MAGLFLKKVKFWNFTGQETKKKNLYISEIKSSGRVDSYFWLFF